MSCDPDVLFKYSQPSGAASRKPSKGMTEALRHLTESDEMQALVTEARSQGRKVVVHVFHDAGGTPFLIHLGLVRQEAA
jgi:hypothetical protein